MERADITGFAFVVSEHRLTVGRRVAFLGQRHAGQETRVAATEPGDVAGMVLAGDHVEMAVVVEVVELWSETDAAPLGHLEDGALGIPRPLELIGELRVRIGADVEVDADRRPPGAHREIFA